jgi:hypothetical protein
MHASDPSYPSNDVHDRVGAVYAIQQLIDVPVRLSPSPVPQHAQWPVLKCRLRIHLYQLGETVSRLQRFAGFLHAVLSSPTELRLADAAAQCLGTLVRAGGALTADVAEREVRARDTGRRSRV